MTDSSELDGLLILGVALALATIASAVRGTYNWAKRDLLTREAAEEHDESLSSQRRAA